MGLRFGLGPLRFYIPIASTKKKRKRRKTSRKPSSRFWTHEGCSIHHKTPDAANRCRVGRR